MSLKDAEQRLEQVFTCKFVDFYDALDKDDKSTFSKWLADIKPAGWISRVVTADGKHLNEKTLKRHLDGHCKCPETAPHKGAYRGA
jgi:hypothetical protein